MPLKVADCCQYLLLNWVSMWDEHLALNFQSNADPVVKRAAKFRPSLLPHPFLHLQSVRPTIDEGRVWTPDCDNGK